RARDSEGRKGRRSLRAIKQASAMAGHGSPLHGQHDMLRGGASAMGFFGKIFGRRKEAGKLAQSALNAPAANAPAANPSKDPNLIRAYDGYGREMYIPREHWRTKILPDRIRAAWEKPDELYNAIHSGLTDGFV